jgi:hypothetical protein
MKPARTYLLAALFGAGRLLAQNAATPSSQVTIDHPLTAVLAGVVTKDPGSDPVKKTLIELIAESQSDGGNYTALTGADGKFRIEDIAPGRHRLFVERTGYRQLGNHPRLVEGRTLTLSASQEIDGLVIRLQAAAVVEGRVTDEDGDPMPEAQVAVLRQTFVSGRSRWEQVGAERTNDLGEYRISSLAAGNYFVSVTPPPDFRSLIEANAQAANATASDKPAPAYQTTYYPGTRDRGQATAIRLNAGDDFPADFSLTPSATFTIRGMVANLAPASTATIMLQSKDFNLVLNGAEMRKDGSFEIRDVSPGSYTILATVDNATVPMMARQPLQVTSANVEGLRLAPQPGGTVHGHLRMEAGGTAGARPDPSRIILLLRSADRDDDPLSTFTMGESSRVAHVNSDGSFEWEDMPPGRFSVDISESSSLPDWFLKSAISGGQDALESGFTVGAGTTLLDLLASANGSVAEGVVTQKRESENGGVENDRPENDEPVADAVVVAVPEARLRTHSYRRTITDQRGHFTLRGLPPGNYTLFAWESVDGEAYYNPQFLKSYEGQGKALSLSEGERKSLQIKAIPASEDLPEERR